jgi:Protein of unknown function (DUF3047)
MSHHALPRTPSRPHHIRRSGCHALGRRAQQRMTLWARFSSLFSALFGVFLLAACQPLLLHPHSTSSDEDADQPVANGTPLVPTGAFESWVPRPMPTKRWADFEPVVQDGRAGLQVRANDSLSLLHRPVSAPGTDVRGVEWSWWLERELPDADLAQADNSDSALRLLLMFGGDRDRLSGRDAAVSELLRLVTGYELPFATLTYVWTRQYPVGTVLRHPRTDRIRYLVVEQGPGKLRQWVSYSRDIQADFRTVFGEEPGPMTSVGLMTDTDDTSERTRVVFGPVSLRR